MSMFLGGPNDGSLAKQTTTRTRDSSDAMNRRILRAAVPRAYTTMSINGQDRVATPFRAFSGTDDYLSRTNYQCGGAAPSTTNMTAAGRARSGYAPQQSCDQSGIEGSSTNPKFVADSSDFARFRGLAAQLRTYNR